MMRVLEDVFRTLIKKKFGSDENFNFIVNPQKGDLELWRVREIVPAAEVTDERTQISLSEAQSIDENYEVGEECYEQLELEDFGRLAILAARQTLISRIMELEKDEIYKRYFDRIGVRTHNHRQLPSSKLTALSYYQCKVLSGKITPAIASTNSIASAL